MSLYVCPAATVAAPVEIVWELLSSPEGLAEWIDGRIERAEPQGPLAPEQELSISAPALGRTWHMSMTLQNVDLLKHQLELSEYFPLAIELHTHISCTPIDANSCRVQYG